MMRSFIQRLGQRNPDCVFERLDPRCKLIILILVTAALIFANDIICLGLFVTAGVLAYFSRLIKVFVITMLLAVMLWSVFVFLFNYIINKPLDNPGSMFIGMVFRGGVLAVTGLWFAVTTKLRDLAMALEAWKVPVLIILPLTIAVRFLPTLLNESVVIRDSMCLRRIVHRKRDLLKHPHLIGQSYLALVTIRSLKMADELAAVAETRGLARPDCTKQPRPIRFRKNDYYAFIITAGLMSSLITISLIITLQC